MKVFGKVETMLFAKLIFFAVFLLVNMPCFAEPENYSINPGDMLDISVWNEDALKRTVRVLPDGTIGFPLTGTIKASGKTIEELKKEMTEKLKEYISEPVVSIAVQAAEGNGVYVTGQVKNPGKFIMTEPMNVMQALSLAGGLTPFAEKDDIVILRKNDKGAQSIKFEYSDLEEGNGLDQNHMLKSGDVIVVP